MAHPATSIPVMLHLDVQYYDDEHAQMISAQPFGPSTQGLIADGLTVSEQELVAHSIFTEQKDALGWRSYGDLAAKLPGRIAKFRDYFDVSGGTLRSRFLGGSQTDKGMTEAAGVGASISIANRIFGLHEADWGRIRDSNKRKSLDFLLASTGSAFIQLEAKGSIVEDAKLKNSSISKHKADITAKKDHAVHAPEAPSNASVSLLGVIAAIPYDHSQRAACWLVDPPARIAGDPVKFKLLSRMTFYLRMLRPLTSSAMLTALADRIEALLAAQDYQSLDGVPLRSANQSRFKRSPLLFRNKTIVSLTTKTGASVDAFGRSVELANGEFAFVGIDSEIYRMLASQDFNEILKYASPYRGVLPQPREFDALLPSGPIREQTESDNRWRRVRVRGLVQALESGIVVGTARGTDLSTAHASKLGAS